MARVDRGPSGNGDLEQASPEREIGADLGDIIYRIELRPEVRVTYLSAAVEDVLGYAPEDFARDASLLLQLMHPDDFAAVREWIHESPPSGRGRFRLRILCRDGSVVWTEHEARVEVDADGSAVALRGIARDVTVGVREEIHKDVSLAIANALVGSEFRIDDVLDATVSSIVPAVGRCAAIRLYDASLHAPRRAVVHSTDPRLAGAVRSVYDRVDPDPDAGDIWPRDGRPHLVHEPDPGAASPQTAALIDAGIHGYIVVPVRARGRNIGLLFVGRTKDQPRYTDADAHLLGRIAERVAIAVETATSRSRSTDPTDLTKRSLALADLAETLTKTTTDYAALLRTIAARTAALIGDGCLITVLADDGATFEVIVDHRNPRAHDMLMAASSATVLPRSQEPFATVLATGEHLALDEISQSDLAAVAMPDYVDYVQQFGPHSALTVPMQARGEVLGTISVGRDAPGRPYTEADRLFLEDVATRAALAIANAKLLRETQHELSRRSLAEKRLAEVNAELARLVFHERVTGLPNRNLCMDRLDHALSVAKTRNRTAALLFCDLDRFKVINDSLGHEVGDAVLVEIARRFTAAVPSDATLGAFGGDEFVVILEDVIDATTLGSAEAMLRALEAEIHVGDHDIKTTASVGIAQYDGGDVNAEELLRQADVALCRAKDLGGARWVRFDETLRPFTGERFRTETELRSAIQNDQLRLEYQPIIAAADGETAAGVECLVTWDHPTRGLVRAGDFIPLAEETGLIVPLGEWVLETACTQIRSWDARGAELRTPGAVHVNLSTRQLAQPGFVDKVAAVLDATGVTADRLCLEITETALTLEPQTAGDELAALKELGVRTAVDDFGIEYSALSYLMRFPLDILKIDRSFVALLPDGTAEEAIVRAIVQLAHSMGMQVIAEGVETEDQFRLLVALGCDMVQGYLFGHPSTGPDFENGLRAQPASQRGAAG